MEKNLLVFYDVTLSTGDLHYFYHLLYHLLFLSGTCTISSSTVPFLCRPSLLSPPIPISIGHLHYLLLDHLLLWEMSTISSIGHLQYLLLEHLLLSPSMGNVYHLLYRPSPISPPRTSPPISFYGKCLPSPLSAISNISSSNISSYGKCLPSPLSAISNISSSNISFYGKCLPSPLSAISSIGHLQYLLLDHLLLWEMSTISTISSSTISFYGKCLPSPLSAISSIGHLQYLLLDHLLLWEMSAISIGHLHYLLLDHLLLSAISTISSSTISFYGKCLPSPLSAISTISSSIIFSYGKCLPSPPLTSPLIGYLLLLPAFSAISSSFSLTRPLRPPGLQVTIGAAG